MKRGADMISATAGRRPGKTNVLAVVAKYEARLPMALQKAGHELIDDSLERVPRDTEALADSASVHWLDGTFGFDSVIIVGYARYGFSKTGPNRHGRIVTRQPSLYVIDVHEALVPILTGEPFFLSAAVPSSWLLMRQAITSIMTNR